MSARMLRAVLLTALTVAGLSACDTKVGQAAIVGGHRISDSDVAKYVSRSGPTQTVRDNAKAQGQTLEPKVQVLSTLIQEQVFTIGLRAISSDTRKGVPTDAQLEALHDEAVTRLLGSTAAGESFDRQLISQAKAYGFTEEFAHLVVRTAELEDELVNRTGVQSFAGLVTALGKHPISISVSKRYGTWQRRSLSLSDDPESGLPPFVSFAPTPTLQSPAP